MQIRKMFVAGAGFMGSGIAQVAALSGFQVLLYDTNPGAAEKALTAIETRFSSSVSKGKMAEEEKKASLSRLKVAAALEEAADCDLVIEAIIEKLDAKTDLFRKLETVCREDAILASNTSSISITTLASVLKHPNRFIGMHFFSPVPVMKLLEIIPGLRTSDETVETARSAGDRLGKVMIFSKDMPGFIVNRMLDLMANEAVQILDEGIGTVEEIDAGMKFGCNHAMGPMELGDMAGIDILLAVMEVFYAELGDSKYRPAPLLRRMVQAGFLGKKTGIGFYVYDAQGNRIGVNPIFRKKS